MACDGEGLLVGVVHGELTVLQVVALRAAHQLGHRGAALPQRGGHAVAGGVAGADDDHIPALRRGNGGRQAELVALHGGLQVFRAEVHAGNALGVQPQGPGLARAAAEDDGVVFP